VIENASKNLWQPSYQDLPEKLSVNSMRCDTYLGSEDSP